jgi:hypothetical protein
MPVNEPTSCSTPQEAGQQGGVTRRRKNIRWISDVMKLDASVAAVELTNSSENSESLRKFGGFCFVKRATASAELLSPH